MQFATVSATAGVNSLFSDINFVYTKRRREKHVQNESLKIARMSWSETADEPMSMPSVLALLTSDDTFSMESRNKDK